MRMFLAVLSNLLTDFNKKQKHMVLCMQLKPNYLDGNFDTLTYRSSIMIGVLYFFLLLKLEKILESEINASI